MLVVVTEKLYFFLYSIGSVSIHLYTVQYNTVEFRRGRRQLSCGKGGVAGM